MTIGERLSRWVDVIAYLGRNPVTLLGAVLTTTSGILMVGFWALEILRETPTHPYAGVILFLILPGVFLLGLVLMPLGGLWRRRTLRKAGILPATPPHVDFRQAIWRDAALLFTVATGLNVAILGTATYRGVEHMDSTQFCGQTCHTVMEPEHTAYEGSPHSRVACVACHIGPGANWFVRSKLSGTRQVFAVMLGTYSRPIPSPVHELRPARETCEQCHWPQKFHGDRLRVRHKFADDEANTRTTTVLMLRVGGRNHAGHSGIHGRHLDDEARIEYVSTDGRREVIPKVIYRDDDGKLVEFVSEELVPTGEQLARGERRAMDCVDCHNRPTHAFELPERAVDTALAAGRISTALPFVRQQAVEALRAEYPDRETAARRVVEALTGYYRARHPTVYGNQRSLVTAAASEVRDIYLRNVFPAMKVTWGTHPNHIGHEDFAGCFRCHDDKHKSADGRVISQDCNACHSILALDEENPKILGELAPPE